MATRSSVLAWRIPGMVEPDGLPSMGSHRVGHDWSDLAAAAKSLVHQYHWIWRDKQKAELEKGSPSFSTLSMSARGDSGKKCWRRGGGLTSEPQWLCFLPTLPVYRLLWTLCYTPPANIHLSFPWPRHRHPQQITIGSPQEFLLHHTNQGGVEAGMPKAAVIAQMCWITCH